MEERQVTVDGVSYELARPFLVMATQNPLEMEGTYPLPEAQRDRFTARVSMGYPDRDAELAMLDDRATSDPLTALAPVADAATVRDLVDAVGRLYVSEAVRRYVVALVEATRRSPDLRLGASPRAGLQLLRAARAVGGAGRPRPRAARRRAGPGRRRCWPTGCCSPPTRRSAGAAPSRSSRSCSPACRSRAGAEPRCRDRGGSARRRP